MKKLFVSFTLIALAGILLSSCSNSSKLSFNKRHYRSGIFVDNNSRNKTIPSYNRMPEIISSQTAPNVITTSGKSGIIQKATTSLKAAIIARKTIPSTASGASLVTANTNSVNNFNESPALQNNQALSEGNHDSGDGGRAALSLLWIVIVVILILWLIGFLAGGWGLGGLINILLIVALILLILWLLRVL